MKKIVASLLIIVLAVGNMMPVMAQETSVLSTNIIELNF